MQELKSGSNQEVTIEKLSVVVTYVRDGLIKVKKTFRVPHYSELKDPKARMIYADIRILAQEIKETLERESTRPEKTDPNWKSKILSRFGKSNDRLLEERYAREKSEVERLRKERDAIRLEQMEEKARKQKLRDIEMEEQVRECVKEELIKERNKMQTEHQDLAPMRRSMDSVSRRPAELRGRRSLDGYKRKSYQQEHQPSATTPSSSNVNKAALIAWGAQPQTAANVSSSRPRQTYVYTKPTIRRPVIKSPVRSSPKLVTEPVFENGQKPSIIRTPSSSSSRTNSAKKLPSSSKSRSASPKKLSAFDLRLQTVMENLESVDENACQQIVNEILVRDEAIHWDDISGLNSAKNSLKETVVYPFLRPDLFKGLREPVAGILLFGPPGTGKTMIAKCVATESNSTFFSISASSVLSKFLGESEKLVRALFYLAKKLAPSIIFIDEIDSLLTARSDNENESSRRIKTEFLIRWSSLSSATEKDDDHSENHRVLVLAATNTPWDLDEAARRRFSKRIYIALPDYQTRLYHLRRLLSSQRNQLSESDFDAVAKLTEGFSGSDLTTLAKDAAMEPIRDLGENLISANLDLVRSVTLQDFETALTRVKKSVSPQSLSRFDQWATAYGVTGV